MPDDTPTMILPRTRRCPVIICTVCGFWYPQEGRDTLDICEPCYSANFAGAQPPLDIHAPVAREALEAYVYPDHQITPRQAQALARLDAVWHRQAHEEAP